MSSGPTLPDWLAHPVAALQAGDIEGWMELYAPDAVHEFPFAPEDAPARVEGREAIGDYMRAVFTDLRFGPLSDVLVHEAGDETIIEATGHHRRLSGGDPKPLGFVWIVTRREGWVIRYRDYMNPLHLAAL